MDNTQPRTDTQLRQEGDGALLAFVMARSHSQQKAPHLEKRTRRRERKELGKKFGDALREPGDL